VVRTAVVEDVEVAIVVGTVVVATAVEELELVSMRHT
jgi:hypothetical protein